MSQLNRQKWEISKLSWKHQSASQRTENKVWKFMQWNIRKTLESLAEARTIRATLGAALKTLMNRNSNLIFIEFISNYLDWCPNSNVIWFNFNDVLMLFTILPNFSLILSVESQSFELTNWLQASRHELCSRLSCREVWRFIRNYYRQTFAFADRKL